MTPDRCTLEGCDNPVRARGFCNGHYQQARRNGELAPLRHRNKGTVCSAPECEAGATSKGMCQSHYSQHWRGQQVGPVRKQRARGEGHINSSGYRMISTPKDALSSMSNNKIMEHRYVMEKTLGRPLLPGENVHHINGVRDDNRPENLELWVTSQPAGQRPEDLVEWAKEILRRYDT